MGERMELGLPCGVLRFCKMDETFVGPPVPSPVGTFC